MKTKWHRIKSFTGVIHHDIQETDLSGFSSNTAIKAGQDIYVGAQKVTLDSLSVRKITGSKLYRTDSGGTDLNARIDKASDTETTNVVFSSVLLGSLISRGRAFKA